MPKANHGQLREEALRAMRSGQADPSVYEPWLILRNESPASSNKGVLADITGALADPRRLRDPVLGWAEWWVGQPLHEREALTPSGSYRPDMDIGAWVLAGIALDAGATVLASRLLDRSRAGLSYLLLGAGLAPTRAITDHGIPGTAMIVIGNGKLLPLPGSGGRAPRIIQAGKRGHVRADLRDVGERVEGGSSFAGAWMYESGWSLSAMVAQALGMPYDGKPVSWEHGMFVECRRRWPSLPPYGYGSAERSDGRDLLANLADPDAARRIVKLAAEALPALPFEFVRYSDRSIVVVANELDESSTGGVAIAAQWSNGNWLHASCDTGGRAKDDIRAQRVVEVGGAFECFHVDRPDKRLRVVKPRGVAEAWRAIVRPLDGIAFSVGGRPPLDDTQEIEPPVLPPESPPQPRPQTLRVRPLSVAECRTERVAEGSWIVSSSSPTARLRDIHGEPTMGEPRRWVIEP